jgi:hypothetical protein
MYWNCTGKVTKSFKLIVDPNPLAPFTLGTNQLPRGASGGARRPVLIPSHVHSMLTMPYVQYDRRACIMRGIVDGDSAVKETEHPSPPNYCTRLEFVTAGPLTNMDRELDRQHYSPSGCSVQQNNRAPRRNNFQFCCLGGDTCPALQFSTFHENSRCN